METSEHSAVAERMTGVLLSMAGSTCQHAAVTTGTHDITVAAHRNCKRTGFAGPMCVPVLQWTPAAVASRCQGRLQVCLRQRRLLQSLRQRRLASFQQGVRSYGRPQRSHRNATFSSRSVQNRWIWCPRDYRTHSVQSRPPGHRIRCRIDHLGNQRFAASPTSCSSPPTLPSRRTSLASRNGSVKRGIIVMLFCVSRAIPQWRNGSCSALMGALQSRRNCCASGGLSLSQRVFT